MTTRKFVGILLCLQLFAALAQAANLIPETATWKYLKGTAEASTPTSAWRAVGFNDGPWLSGPATFYYGEPRTGTELTDMLGGYTSVYFRKTFTIANASEVSGLTLTVDSDDGFIAWINGVEVARYNVDPGDLPFNGVATAALEPVVSTYTIPNQGGLLQNGNNVLAVHGFNASLSGSSDFVFLASLDSIVAETVPPVIQTRSPAPGTITALTQITVEFSEPVMGVNATDLLLNGVAATTISGTGSAYTFSFPQPPYGTVTITWANGHGIADQALPPNPFDGAAPAASWQYTLVDQVPPTISSLTPTAGSTVAELTQIDVVFSEGVTGVQATDLEINGSAATNVVINSASFYTFQFPQPQNGVVTLHWVSNHGIRDLAPVPNAFVAANWIYVLDPQAAITQVVISEFLASHDTGLKDEDGDFSDWIEIYNAGTTSVNLKDWALTDSAGDLGRWKFPATNFPPAAFMIVFASEKDRAVAGRQLHTNFRISNGGEYLALVRPDGTIASEFQNVSQARNVSYGYGFEVSNFNIVPTNAPVRVLVPSNDSLGDTWLQPNFNDGTWTAGINGVGFDTGSSDPGENTYEASVDATGPVGYWRLNETSGTAVANRGTGGTTLNGTYVGGPTLGQPGPRPPAFGGFEAGNNAPRFSGTQYANTTGGLLSGRAAFTIGGWVNPAATPGSRIGLFGQNDAVEFGFISSSTIQVWTPNGGSLDVTYTFPANSWHHVVAVGDGQALRIYFDGNLAGTGGTATANYGTSSFLFNIGGGGIFDTSGNNFNGWIDEVVLYQRALSAAEISALYTAGLNPPNTPLTDLINTDIRNAMLGVNSSAYIRIPFNVSNPGIVDRMGLRMRYDDGFTAFLNGQVIAQANSPLDPAFNAAATAQHPDFAARQYVDFDLPGLAGLLTAGDNVLAIQGLNFATAGNDFLIQAELNGTSIGALGTTPRYFTTPSPGAPNGAGSSDLGPIIAEVGHTPEVPTDAQNIIVTANVVQGFRPVTSVVLRWQVMFGAVNELNMVDDGAHGDGAAGDRIYGATIPASASTPGQMVRWYVRALDSQGNVSRWPLFDDPLDSEEFLGTIVATNIVTKLPLVHLFVANAGAADTTAGTRCSIYYLGEFYDHVEINLHGQSSAGFPKKSYDLDFPKDHRFLYKQGKHRVKDIKFLTNWGDKARVRNSLGYEFIERAGSLGHFSFQFRMQQNGVFFSIADMVEDADDLWMERLGRDPNGALYKIYDNLSGVGSAEKKTRREENNSDLQVLITSLDPASPIGTRVNYAYDNLDIPQAISYLTVCALISHQDHGHKNYYVYRDSDGNREWSIIPWDIDLSWGRNWTDAGGYFTDTMYVDNVLDFYNLQQQNKGRNRYYDLFYNHPDFRAMYLRRLRTIMDTVIQPPGTPSASGIIETRVRQMEDLMDPPEIGTSDADLDFARWGSWGNNGQMRPEADRLMSIHLTGRREFLFNNPNAILVGTRIPSSQPQNIGIKIGAIEYNPSSANQAQEFICLTNPNPFAVDISGWKLDGGIEFNFRPGTVLASNGTLYVSPDVNAFRARTTAPRGGQGLFVQGPYHGQLSARGEQVLILDPYGRQVDQQTYAGAPSPAQRFLRVTELMYNPSPLEGNPADPQNFEYTELRNISTTETLSLTGVKFVAGILFDFTGSAVTSLTPGQRVLIVKDQAAFAARYPGIGPIAGVYEGNLDSAGEHLRLVDASGEEILDFEYNNSWYPTTDGLGFSLVVVDEAAEPDLWSSRTQWKASGHNQGSPAAVDPAPPSILPVLINEVLSRSETPPPTDTIELINTNAAAAPIGDWYLSDDLLQPKKYRILSGTSIPGNSIMLFDESAFNPAPGVPPSFALGSDGDEVYLFSADAAGELTGYFHGFKFGASENGVTFGRHTISTGAEHFVAQNSATLGAANSGPKIGPVVISEVHYHPLENADGSDNSHDEYIELVNVSGSLVSLFDPMFTTNTWELTDAVDFKFPADVHMAAGERILVVNFDPADVAARTDFRNRFGVNPDVQLFGPFQGQLDNSSDSVELKKPSILPPFIRVLVLVDKVEYSDDAPWPNAADGFGLSLQRVNESSYGNDPANWVAVAPTAGAAQSAVGTAPSIVSSPQSKTVLAGTATTFSVNASGTGPLKYQWRFKGLAISGATAATLNLPNVQLPNLGEYEVVVHNSRGSVASAPALLMVQLPASIIAQPQSVTVTPGVNVTLSVQAFGNGTITYRWFKNNIPINGATASTLNLLNVQFSDAATYFVEVTDSIGTLRSDPAVVQLLIVPTIVVQPVPQTNAVGSTVTFGIEVTNTATLPIGYRWRKGGGTLTNRVLNTRSDFLTLNNIQLGDAATYSVVITNAASIPPGVLSSSARLGVVQPTDMDMDGMPDQYEMDHGLNKASAADASADPDHDGYTNLQEYQAGTDPQDGQSYLQVESWAATSGVVIRFRAVNSKTYSVLYRDLAASGTWQVLAGVGAIDSVSLATHLVEVTDPAPPQGAQRYYRLVTPGMSPP